MSDGNTPHLPVQGKSARLPIGNYRKELGIFGLLLTLCIVVSILNHDFFGVQNVQDLTRLTGIYGIFSIGMGIVIITGGIDLSVGSVFALLGVVLAIFLNTWHLPWIVAVLGVLIMTMGLGVFHGWLITRISLQPFIVTLCGLLFYRGMARFIAQDQTVGFADAKGYTSLQWIATGKPFGVPMPFILLIVISIIMWVVLHRSVYGRYLFAVGRNEEASRYSGINSKNIIASAYVVSGALAGIAGILLAFYTNSISPSTHGNSYELYGIAAAVLGGCSLRGGEGSIIGILIGTAILRVLQNLIIMLGIPSSLEFSVVGAVILLGVIADEVIKRRSTRTKVAPVAAAPAAG